MSIEKRLAWRGMEFIGGHRRWRFINFVIVVGGGGIVDEMLVLVEMYLLNKYTIDTKHSGKMQS